MLLEITSTAPAATDLGYLLHKNPANVRSIDLAFGRAHVFYPHATPDRCTAALLVEVDPIGLVRRGRGRPAFSLAEYVNDRPYVGSSFSARRSRSSSVLRCRDVPTGTRRSPPRRCPLKHICRWSDAAAATSSRGRRSSRSGPTSPPARFRST